MNVLRLPTLEGIRPRRFGLVSWSPHVAFAFDLMADLRPQLFVELGTHSGESYFAFCQSARENRLGATCYAVDTWKGDPQAGFYPEDVYAEVYRHNQEFYANFSYLIRATFDEAVDKFVDGSVDLIHFDGCHTYEAVKHDLERWRPKLSPRGVALFHDIAARHDDFGAWKLWDELTREGRSFAFRHGWGLGVWQPSGGQPSGSILLETLFEADEAEAENIRRYYVLATEALRLQNAATENLRLDGALKAATAEAEALREEGKRRDAILNEQAIRCDEALRVQAVLREEATQRDEFVQEALRVQTVLRGEATQRDATIRAFQEQANAAQNNLPGSAVVQVYFDRDGVFSEADSHSVPCQADQWQRIGLPVPDGWQGGTLRVDPGNGFGLAEVSGVRLRTMTLNERVWELYGSGLRGTASAQGSASLVPGARTLRVLCAEPDPQIILPVPKLDRFDEPLTLEIGIRLRTEWPALVPTFQQLAREVTEWPALQQNLRDLTRRLAEAERTQLQEEERHAARWQSMQARLDENEGQRLDLDLELKELRNEITKQKEQETAANQEIGGLLAELHTVNLQLAEKDQSLAEIYHRLVEKDGQLVAAQAQAETEHRRGRSMRRSFSWKLTVPLRALGRLLTGKITAQQRARRAAKEALPVPGPVAAVDPERNGYRLHVDSPVHWNLPTRRFNVCGWCLPPAGNAVALPTLRFHFGDRQIDVPCNVPRADVQAALGDHPQWRNCGFDAPLELPPGPSEIKVEAVDAQGQSWPLANFSARTPYAETALRAPTNNDAAQDYASWIKQHDSLSSEDRARLRKKARELPYRPLISVVMPVYNAPAQWLIAAIESVRRQIYPYWEFCIADDHSPQPHIQETLRRYEQMDERIKVVYRPQNGHISAASNSALEVATGEFVALLDHDDELAVHALYEVAKLLNEQPGLQMIYSDEDKIGVDGERRDPYFKPDWNYDLFLGQNMFSHLGVYRRELLNKIGGFQVGLEGSQDYDLALRCLEHIQAREIGHIPRVLYHWRMIPGSTAVGGDEKPYAREAARRAIGQHLNRLGQGATVEQNPWLVDFHRVRYPLPVPAPEVAIIIPTRDHVEVLRTCIESTLSHTEYPNYRLVVVDNGSREPETKTYLQELRRRLPERFQVLDYPGEFNFSAINNLAVRQAGAPVLCFLNNDIEATQADWLTELVSQASRPDVGAVGARLLYPDGTLQHAGVIIGLGADRTAGHAHHRLSHLDFGYFGRAKLVQQFSAVTAACMVLRREVFEEVGGFNEQDFPVGLNDVDLCLRLREKGRLIVWTPFATLTHHESYSRGLPTARTAAAERARREIETFRRRHERFIAGDPAYNPNLTLDHSNFSLNLSPRGTKN